MTSFVTINILLFLQHFNINLYNIFYGYCMPLGQNWSKRILSVEVL